MSVDRDGFPEIPGFRITGRLGQGSMAVVYRAIQLEMNRPVALKILREDLFRDDRARNRILREARLAARCNHPHVVRVHDAGVEAGRGWLAMDLVEGRTLKERLERQGPFDEESVLALARQIASALERFEADGLVHRDIKPGNILLDAEERALLLDFGLATITWDARYRTRSRAVGTPAYMAPEQATDPDAVTIRSDFFALGATLYHLTTGTSAFDAPQLGEVISRILYHMPPGPRSLAPELSRGLDALIMRMIAKDPADRPQSVAELRSALDRLPADESEADRPPRLVSRPLLWAGGALAALAVGGLVVLGGAADEEAPDDTSATTTAAARPDLEGRTSDELTRLAEGPASQDARALLSRRGEAALAQLAGAWTRARDRGAWRDWLAGLEGDEPARRFARAAGFVDVEPPAFLRVRLDEAATAERRQGLARLEPLRVAQLAALAEELGGEAKRIERMPLDDDERRLRYERHAALFVEGGVPLPTARVARAVEARLAADARILDDLRKARFAEIESALAAGRGGRVRRALAELREDFRFSDEASRRRATQIAARLADADGRTAERLALTLADFVDEGTAWGEGERVSGEAPGVSRFASYRARSLDVAAARAWWDRLREGIPEAGDETGTDAASRSQWLAIRDLTSALERLETWSARLHGRWASLKPGARFRGRDRNGRSFDGAEVQAIEDDGETLVLALGGEVTRLRPRDLDLNSWRLWAEVPAVSAAVPHERAAQIWLSLIAGAPGEAFRHLAAAENDGAAPASIAWLRRAGEAQLRRLDDVGNEAERAALFLMARVEEARRRGDVESGEAALARLRDPATAPALSEGVFWRRHEDWLREGELAFARHRSLARTLGPYGEFVVHDAARGEISLTWTPDAERRATLKLPSGVTAGDDGFHRSKETASIVPGAAMVLRLPEALTLKGRRDWEVSFTFTPDDAASFRWLIFGMGPHRAGQLDRLRRRGDFASEPWHGLERGLVRDEVIGQAVLWTGPLEGYRAAFRGALAGPAEGLLEKERNPRFRLVMTSKNPRLTLWRGQRRLASTPIEDLPERAGFHVAFPSPGTVSDLRIRGTLADQGKAGDGD